MLKWFLGLKKSLPEDYKKVGIPTYKSVTDEFEIYKTAIANESGKFNISEIYTSDGLTMVRRLKLKMIGTFSINFLFRLWKRTTKLTVNFIVVSHFEQKSYYYTTKLYLTYFYFLRNTFHLTFFVFDNLKKKLSLFNWRNYCQVATVAFEEVNDR